MRTPCGRPAVRWSGPSSTWTRRRTDAADAYLRLHLLSHRLVQPNTINLDGHLRRSSPNVVWTNRGPCLPEGFEAVRLSLLADGPVEVRSRRQVPEDDRLRACRPAFASPTPTAYASAPTSPRAPRSCTRASCNFNAGTLGVSMVEGRIVQGVVVDDGSDVGGGASIMGTLSGGGTERVRVGKRCLLGAQSGLGIALGDDCVVEAGLYVTAGTKVTLPDGRGRQGARALRTRQPAVHPQLGHRHRRGARPFRLGHPAERCPPRQRLTDGPETSTSAPATATAGAVAGSRRSPSSSSSGSSGARPTPSGPKLQSELFSPSCTATTSAGSVTFSPEQVANAALIAAISDKRGLPPRAASIAITTAIQESQAAQPQLR